MSDFAEEHLFSLHSDTKMVADFAEWAHERMKEGDPSEALQVLLRCRDRYGDLFGLRMKLDDAISALEKRVAVGAESSQ